MNDKIDFKTINILIKVVLVFVVIVFADYLNIFPTLFNILLTLTPFFIAMFICWLFTPVGAFIHKVTGINLRLANGLSILSSVLLLFFFFSLFVPIIIVQISKIVEQAPMIFQDLAKLAEDIGRFLLASGLTTTEIQEFFNKLLENSFVKSILTTDNLKLLAQQVFAFLGFFTDTISVFLQIVVAYVISFYFISDLPVFTDKVLKLTLGQKHQKAKPIVAEMSTTIFGYFKGLILDCSIVAILVAVGTSMIGLPSPLLLGTIAGVTNVIPYLGPILGGIPTFIIALSMGWQTTVLAMIVIFGVQFVESNFLQPRIMASATNLHPVTIIIGLLVFGSLFGFVGMVFATPVLSLIGVALKYSKYDIQI